MIRNFIKTTGRNLLRNRGYATINLVGLTLGLGVVLVLFWIVRFEYGFDRYHAKADRLYKVRDLDKFGEMQSHVPQGAINALRRQIPGVEKAANVRGIPPGALRVGQQLFDLKNVFFVEPDFLEMIDAGWLQGSPRQSLSLPNQVVLDEPTAKRFFRGNPIGRVIRMDNKTDLTVTGVIRQAPANSEFQFPMLISYETMKRLEDKYSEEYWGGGDSFQHGYVLLKPGTYPASVEAALTKLVLKRKNQASARSYNLLPMAEAHFDPTNDPFNYFMPTWMLYTLMGIGSVLIVIACINFINLATVQATQRSREIAVRKVLGSSRGQLVAQFLGETALLVAGALALGSVLGTWLLAYADQLLNTKVTGSNPWDGPTVGFLLLLGGVVTVLAGLYPALVLSGFQPVQALRNRGALPRRGVPLRQALVVTQFVVAQVLVICTLLGVQQVRYMAGKDLGYNREAVVAVQIPERRQEAAMRERLRTQLLQRPEIKAVSFGLATPASDRNNWWDTIEHPSLPNGEATFRLQHVDERYFDFFEVPLLAGRTLTPADSAARSVVINEKAMRDLGFREPHRVLGQSIKYWGEKRTIVGVVKDYHSQDLKSKLIPHVFAYSAWNFQSVSVRVDPRRIQPALQAIEQAWKAQFPNHYFKYQFLDDTLRTFYENERKLANFLTLFALVGIFIGCLGLFGLVSFVVTQRTKEIGVRKVLGATVASIVSLLSKDFLKLVFVAFVIAAPIAWYAMRQFLQEYEYKITIEWWVFAVAGGLAVGIALLTVSFQSIKAALTNPVKSLRSE
ncbi:MAG: ABC transporter permease [Sphingobacteriaceae bacterium]|nr:ABC transporter permease [Cytophagaceae bacterium]